MWGELPGHLGPSRAGSLQQLTRLTASGCSPRDSHKVAQGHGGGEADRGGAAVLGDQELAFPPFSELAADFPRSTEVWAGRYRGCK